MSEYIGDSVFSSNELYRSVMMQLDQACAIAGLDPNVADVLKNRNVRLL